LRKIAFNRTVRRKIQKPLAALIYDETTVKKDTSIRLDYIRRANYAKGTFKLVYYR